MLLCGKGGDIKNMYIKYVVIIDPCIYIPEVIHFFLKRIK